MKYRGDYARVNWFGVLNEELDRLDLIQLLNFTTWSRIVINDQRTPILDHNYVTPFSLL